jgi:Protein of unknown function (DUF2924)
MLQRFIDPAAVADDVESVRSLSGDALRRRWQAAFGTSPPKRVTAELRRRMLAMRVQEEAFGTLDTATFKALDKLAGRNRPAERNLKIGTVLVRDYHGQRHTVMVESEGYVWEGQRYSSLSAIARTITGTAWSGPRFFSLKGAERGNFQLDGAYDRQAGAKHKKAQAQPSVSGSAFDNPDKSPRQAVAIPERMLDPKRIAP